MLLPLVLMLAPARRATPRTRRLRRDGGDPVRVGAGVRRAIRDRARLHGCWAYHISRPLEIESVLATPLWMARLAGATTTHASAIAAGSQVIDSARLPTSLAQFSAVMLVAGARRDVVARLAEAERPSQSARASSRSPHSRRCWRTRGQQSALAAVLRVDAARDRARGGRPQSSRRRCSAARCVLTHVAVPGQLLGVRAVPATRADRDRDRAQPGAGRGVRAEPVAPVGAAGACPEPR